MGVEVDVFVATTQKYDGKQANLKKKLQILIIIYLETAYQMRIPTVESKN